MNRSIHVRRYIRTSLLLTTVFLLLVNIAGIFLHPSFNLHPTFNKTDLDVPGYSYAVSDKKVLLKMLAEKGNVQDSSFVNNTTKSVFYSTIHTEQRRIAFYENWIMWLWGKFYAPAGRTQDAELLVKGGAGNCSERTQVLMDIFKLNGLNCRIISLNGHVAQQVLFKDQWMVTDADYGLVYKGDMKQMETGTGLKYADSVLTHNGFNKEMRDRYLFFWKTGNDNVLSPLNKVSNPRLYQAEQISQWLCWIIPVLILIICIIPEKRKNYNKVTP